MSKFKAVILPLVTAAAMTTNLCGPPSQARGETIPTRPKQVEGSFFRITTEIIYKGRPTTITYVAGCNLLSSKQIDGDRSVDGAALVPMLWGERMPDGGAVVIKTPRMCGGQTTANGNVPRDYMPTLVHFESADRPWFGRAYMTREAYAQPVSVMTFVQSEISSATEVEWATWRRNESPKNIVRYQITELTQDWFKRKPWTPGTRWMPMRCQYATILKVPGVVKEAISGFWPQNKPDFWTSEGAYMSLAKLAGHPSYPRPTDALFEGRRFWDRERPDRPLYPIRTDFDINLIDNEAGMAEVKGPLTLIDVVHKHDERGFAYCQKLDSPLNLPKQMSGSGIHRYQGIPLQDAADAMGFKAYGFVRDEFFITFGSFQLHTKGGAL